MADDNVEEYQLLISAQDNASATISQTNAALTQTLAITQELNAANTALAAEAALPFDQASAAAETMASQVGAAIIPLDDLADSIHKVGDELNGVDLAKFDKLTNGGGIVDDSEGGGGGFSLTSSRRGLTALGSLAGGSPGLSEAARLVSVGAAFGIVGVAAAAAAIAVKGYSDSLAASTERAKAFGDALEKAFEGTATDVQKYIDQTKAQIAADTAVRDALQKLADSAPPQLASNLDNASQSLDNFLNTAAGTPELNQKVNDAGISQEAYNSQIDDYSKKIQLAQIGLDAYNSAIGTNIVATNDAVDKAHKLALSQEADADRALAIDQLTKAQRDERHAQDERDVETLTRLVGASDLNDESLRNVAGRIDVLNADLKDLDGVTSTYADQLEREAAAKQSLTDANQKTLDSLNQEGGIRDKIASTEADIQQVRTDAADKAAELQKEYFAKDDEATRQADEKLLNIAEDTAEKRAKIERDSGQDLLNDIGARDAYKYLLDEQKEQKELTDAQAADKKAQDLALDAEQKAYRTDGAAYDKSLAQLEQSIAKELTAKDRALQQENVDLQNNLAGQLALSQQYHVGIVSSVQSMWQDIQSVFNEVSNSVQYNLHAAAYGGSTTPVPYSQYTAPGYTPVALPPPVNGYGTQGSRNIQNVYINGVGMSLDQVVNHSLSAFDVLVGAP